MNATLRRRLEMAERVRDFLRAHKTDAVGEGLGLAKLEELIQRAELLGAQQRAGVAVARTASAQRGKPRPARPSKLPLYLRGGCGPAAAGDGPPVEYSPPPPPHPTG